MNYMQRVMERIENDKPVILNFDYDELSKTGAKANVIGLTRYKKRWLVQLEFHDYLGSGDNITLDEYMEKTKDIK